MTIPEAQVSKNNGITMLVVAIGPGVRIDEARQVASSPYPNHLFFVNNFDSLPLAGDQVLTALCDVAG